MCWLACTHIKPKAHPTGLLKMTKGGFGEPGQTILSSKSCIQFCILCGQTWHHVRSHAAKDWAWQCFPWKENQLVLSGPLLVSLPGPKAGPAGLSKKARTVSEGKNYNIFFRKRGLGGHKRFGYSLQNSSNLDPHVHMSTCPWVCKFVGLQSACPLELD